jgi:hypothetical protein
MLIIVIIKLVEHGCDFRLFMVDTVVHELFFYEVFVSI